MLPKLSASITLEGDNKIFSETGSALHVSDGNVTINGSGSLKAEIQDEPFGYNHNAKIGSHEKEDMSGSIHITGDATVKTDDNIAPDCGGDGAGIGFRRKWGKCPETLSLTEMHRLKYPAMTGVRALARR